MTRARREPPPSRAPLQLHLSTCVVLMFAGGAGLWFNLSPFFLDTVRGWPMPIARELHGELVNGIVWDSGAIVFNAGFWLAILFVVAFTFEALLRRWERRRAAA
ncbi:MAG: hypothetical protein M5U26_23425 [Planctomycetota bacterium]|nr:hypothetical protein [Planctomycetota bacterium]